MHVCSGNDLPTKLILHNTSSIFATSSRRYYEAMQLLLFITQQGVKQEKKVWISRQKLRPLRVSVIFRLTWALMRRNLLSRLFWASATLCLRFKIFFPNFVIFVKSEIAVKIEFKSEVTDLMTARNMDEQVQGIVRQSKESNSQRDPSIEKGKPNKSIFCSRLKIQVASRKTKFFASLWSALRERRLDLIWCLNKPCCIFPDIQYFRFASTFPLSNWNWIWISQ